MTKECTQCHEWLEVEDNFYYNKVYRTYNNICRGCKKLQHKATYIKQDYTPIVSCPCGETDKLNFHKNRGSVTGYQKICKACAKVYNKKYRRRVAIRANRIGDYYNDDKLMQYYVLLLRIVWLEIEGNIEDATDAREALRLLYD